MEKIKWLTDAACDLPQKYCTEYKIETLPISIMLGDEEYTANQNESQLDFYKLLDNVKEVPTTAQITIYSFIEKYETAYKEGYTHLLGLFLPSFASGTYQNAVMASREFYENHPEAKETFHIEIVDTGTYSVAYGYPMVKAAQMVKEGASFDEAIQFVKGWLSEVEIYFSMYSLDYARKSGRLGGITALVGEVLGLKPIICVKNGKPGLYKKVRGKKAIVRELNKIRKERMKDDSIYALLKGTTDDEAEELVGLIKEDVGYEPFGVFYSGPAVTINSGPEIVGIGFRGK